jgi:hypothetical protein
MYNYEPPEAQSIKSMFHIVRILAIVFGILLFLGGLAYVALVWTAYNACNTAFGGCAGIYAGGLGALLIFPIVLVIFGLIDIVIYVSMKGLEAKVNARRYEEAKSGTLIWMILGFILGGIIIGILLLIAYLKFDPLINAARAGPPQPPAGGYYPPPPQAAPPAYGAPAPPPPAPGAAAAPMCPRCGQPATYVAQYGRYYCYNDKQYV